MKQLIVSNPISFEEANHSDVIPTIMGMCRNFLNNEFAYKRLFILDYSLPPTYLPFTWMPFCFAQLLNFDYRWVSFAIFIIVYTYSFFSIFSKNVNPNFFYEKIIVALFPLVIWIFIYYEDTSPFASTVELLFAAYYLLLVISHGNKNLIIFPLALSFCLMSRFSLVIWAPLAVLGYLILNENRKSIFIAAISSGMILAFYVFPFLIKDPLIFKRGYDYYTNASIGEWGKAVNDGGFWHMGNGLGFTKLFIDNCKFKDVPRMVSAYKMLHLILCVTTTLLLTGFVYVKRKKLNWHRFLSCSLKIYLTVFYAFIQVPYKYLFIVPIMVSSGLLINIYSGNQEIKLKN